ncbi:MAG: hypothetical protein ABI130_14505 [Leifsonia sp.]
MNTEHVIDELLRQDEAELREKKKRLKNFATTLDELRRSSAAAAKAATELITSGDLTRIDAARAFQLNKTERAALFPARRESGADAVDEVANAANSGADQKDDAAE